MGLFHSRGDYPMKRFKEFEEDMTTSAVAGAGDDSETVPVHLKKKKKKKDEPKLLSRFEQMRKRWSK